MLRVTVRVHLRTRGIVLALLMLALLAMGAGGAYGDWHLVASKSFDGASIVQVEADGKLRTVVLVLRLREPGSYAIASYRWPGEESWQYRPARSSKIHVVAIAEGAAQVLAHVSPIPPANLPATVAPPAPNLLQLSEADGRLEGKLQLEPGDWGVQVNRDTTILLVEGMNPRFLRQDGSVLSWLKRVEPPLPEGLDWFYHPILLAPDGSYALVYAIDNASDLYHVTADGKRIWELHMDHGAVASLNLPPRFSRGGGHYLLLSANPYLPLGPFKVLRRGEGVPPVPHAVGGPAWALTLLRLSREDVFPAGGGKVRALWGEVRGQMMADSIDGPEPAYQLERTAIAERQDGITIAAAGIGGRLVLYDLDRRGILRSTKDIHLEPDVAVHRLEVAGNPPVILVAGGPRIGDVSNITPEQRARMAQVRVLSLDGEHLFEWTGEGTITDALLSDDGRRAAVATSAALHFFAAE